MLKLILFFGMGLFFLACASTKTAAPLSEENISRRCFNLIIENKTKDFIQQIEECKNVRNPMGLTPMLLSVAKENIDLVEALIAAKVDVNETDKAGMTALVFAANKNNKRIVQLLRRAGARIEVVNNNLSGLMMASRNSSLELIEVMKPTPNEINIPAEDGWTAIYFAITRQDPEIVTYLLDQGACTKIKDNYQQTPLEYAQELEWLEGIKILKRKTKC